MALVWVNGVGEYLRPFRSTRWLAILGSGGDGQQSYPFSKAIGCLLRPKPFVRKYMLDVVLFYAVLS